jgi:kumamolisin
MLNRLALHSYIKHPRAGGRRRRPQPPGAEQPWTVPALCAAYDFPRNATGNGTIAIVELGGGWLQSDVNAFFSGVDLPAPTITNVSVDGTQNSPGGSSADIEVALDIQVAGAVFAYMTGKAANIRIYWSQDIASAVQWAAADGCAVCSISWGADESDWGQAAGVQMEQVATAATNAGMVVLAASGDNDSSDGGSTPANVDLPASAPHVIGCGGTTKTQTTETVWGSSNPDGEGTGGGYSTLFPAQSWQMNIPPAPAGLGRLVPDVAADADPNTGYLIVVGGAQQQIGGTSAVAPLYAGFLAATPGGRGFVTPTLWENRADFNSPIDGTNGDYSQPPCPGPCTGLGSPKGAPLYALFSSPGGGS